MFGTRVVAELLLAPLEDGYETPSVAVLQEAGVSTVVVLTGGGYTPVAERLSSALPHASTHRFLAGMELAVRLGARIVFSGSAGRGARELGTAGHMAALARTLAPGLDVQAETESDSTAEHPANVRKLVGDAPFALVTSASHVPRAMRAFERAGMHPYAYPVDRLVQRGYGLTDALPSGEGYWMLAVAVREYVALAMT
jgi:uncharacterized SAM-binding protein YcdF (DUF218 family)